MTGRRRKLHSYFAFNKKIKTNHTRQFTSECMKSNVIIAIDSTLYRGYSLCNVFTGLKPFTEYSYRVRCIGIGGPSRWSDRVTLVTKRKLIHDTNLL